MSFVHFNNLSIEDLKKIIQNKKHELKKEFNDYNEQKGKLIIAEIDEMKNKENILRNKNQRYHQNLYPCPNQNKKTFDDYFEECIKNKKIPKDTPSYLKKALERAIMSMMLESNMKSQLLRILWTIM